MEQDYMAVNEDEPETALLLSPPPAKSFRPEPAAGRFKGVVLQQNGNWGAQIYAHHQRIWLGTFKSERSAAIAYDRAATKLRASDASRNFPLFSPLEPLFQNLHSTESIVAMIRDGSYEPKLSDFLRSVGGAPPSGAGLKELFQKELTPSDVGKLNRLVIPKKHAVNFFPSIESIAEGVTLEIRDFEDRRWEFRFCYWKSSQSFVFTRGWNKFVKTNRLQSKDIVTFYGGEVKDGFPSFYTIKASRRSVAAGEPIFHSFLAGNGGDAAIEEELARREEEEEQVGGGAQRPNSDEIRSGRKGFEAEAVVIEAAPKKPFQLFGVQISDA